jgi:hypothetical protein
VQAFSGFPADAALGPTVQIRKTCAHCGPNDGPQIGRVQPCTTNYKRKEPRRSIEIFRRMPRNSTSVALDHDGTPLTKRNASSLLNTPRGYQRNPIQRAECRNDEHKRDPLIWQQQAHGAFEFSGHEREGRVILPRPAHRTGRLAYSALRRAVTAITSTVTNVPCSCCRKVT